MGDYVYSETQAKVNDEWIGIEDIELTQNYDLYAYLLDIRNYWDVKPFAYHNGVPDDLKKKPEWWCSYDDDPRCDAWISGEAILKGMSELKPVTKTVYMSLYAFMSWDRMSEPDCYSRYSPRLVTDESKINKISQKQLQYYKNLTESFYSLNLKANYDWKVIDGRLQRVGPKCGKNHLRNLRRVSRYLSFCNVPNEPIKVTYTLTADQQRKEFKPFIDQVRNAVLKYGDIRLLMRVR
ncbi:hypothetical protein [Pseudomonas phage fMGyn-Pae01]|nr:hypothetical protein [Pseudomonas phage fMGyn-Pae01]